MDVIAARVCEDTGYWILDPRSPIPYLRSSILYLKSLVSGLCFCIVFAFNQDQGSRIRLFTIIHFMQFIHRPVRAFFLTMIVGKSLA